MTTTTDWNTIYGTGANKNQNIPLSSQNDLNACVFSDFYLNWTTLQNQTGVSSLPMWQIFCDTFELNNDISVNGALIIFARRIVAPNGTTIALNRTTTGDTPFSIMAQETIDANGNPSSITIETIQENSSITSVSFTSNGTVSGLTWGMTDQSALTYLPAEIGDAFLAYGQPLQLSLMSIFSLSSLIFTSNIGVAMKQLEWISELAQYGTDTLTMAAQAQTFLSTLSSMSVLKEDTILVPALNEQVYAQKAQGCLDFLQTQQTEYTNLQQIEANLQQWAAQAKTFLQVSTVEQNLYTNLQDQAQSTYTQAEYARNLAGQQLVADNNNLVSLQIAFNRGVSDWEKTQEIQDTLNIVKGVVDILAQLPTIVAAGPEMAVLPAVQTAASLLNTANSALNNMMTSKPSSSTSTSDDDDDSDTESNGSDSDSSTSNDSFSSSTSSSSSTSTSDDESDTDSDSGSSDSTNSFSSSTSSSSTTSSTSSTSTGTQTSGDSATHIKRQMMQSNLMNAAQSIGSGAKTIVQSAMAIYDVTHTAHQLEQQGQQALTLANNTVNTAFSSLTLTGVDTVTGGSQNWDNLANDIASLFQTIDSYQIAGASAYQLGIEKLIVDGKAYSKTQLAVAKAASQLAEAKMRQTAAAQKEAIFTQRYQNLGAQITQDTAIGQLLYTKVIDAKRAVYLALESYQRAVSYFTLQPASALPAMPLMTASVNDFASAVTAIAGNELVLSALNPPPQNMGTSNTPGISITLNSPQLINQLTSTAFGSWTISTQDQAFNNFSRIRLNLVRIFLTGISVTQNIEVQIVTNGLYDDINPLGNPCHFAGPPLRLNFVYTGGAAAPTIVFDGQVPSVYANDFFQPTPFTKWTIKVSSQSGQTPDLTGLTGVVVELGGEGTPA